MKKSIPIDSLKIGMFVCDLDRKWWQTDFLLHQFLIKSQGDIEKLKGAGIQVVMVDLARSEVPVLDLPGEIFDKENVLKKRMKPQSLPCHRWNLFPFRLFRTLRVLRI